MVLTIYLGTMKLSYSAVITAISLAFVSGTVAVAIPSTNIAAALAKRDPNGAWCQKFWEGSVLTYQVASWGSWDDDWGQGFLENLRNQCGGDLGNIENWTFYYETGPPPTPGHSQFHSGLEGPNVNADTHCVEDAIWLASNPTGAIWGVECQWK